MRTLFVIDPLETLNLETETSLLLIEELARRGHEPWVATTHDLYLSAGTAGARAHPIRVDLSRPPFFELGAAAERVLGDFRLIMMRVDPPVDATYLFATHVLEQAGDSTLVINDPVGLRAVNEKLLPLHFPTLSPPTLVTRDADRLADFARQHGRVVLKPLSDCSGRGIRIFDAAAAPEAIAAALNNRGGEPLLVQRFLPGVTAGDKRIFLLAGKPIGAVNRIPQSADHLANIHQGARVAATTITEREQQIAATIQPLLHRHGLWLAGIDVIDGWLTEVNVTSPSAVRQINAINGIRLEIPIVDFLERNATNARRGVSLD